MPGKRRWRDELTGQKKVVDEVVCKAKKLLLNPFIDDFFTVHRQFKPLKESVQKVVS